MSFSDGYAVPWATLEPEYDDPDCVMADCGVHPMTLKRPQSRTLLPLFAIVALAFATLAPTQGFAQQDPRVQRGRAFAQTNCASCHQIGRLGESPLRIAPPFRTLHERYAVETLSEALAEGVVTGHPTMPEFQLDADQVGDFIAFLKSLEH